MPVLVELVFEAGDVSLDFGLECRGEHPFGTCPADLVQPERQVRAGIVFDNYSQHWRSFLAGGGTPVFSIGQEGRYAAPMLRWVIHKFWLYLT